MQDLVEIRCAVCCAPSAAQRWLAEVQLAASSWLRCRCRCGWEGDQGPLRAIPGAGSFLFGAVRPRRSAINPHHYSWLSRCGNARFCLI